MRRRGTQVSLVPASLVVVLALALVLLLGGLTRSAAAARPSRGARHGCAHSSVLLLGSYPTEVQANLDRERLEPHQPRMIDGHDFYSGRLDGRWVIIAIAGPSPAITQRVTRLGLTRFSCISAVVFEGTAGGGGRSGLGDVTVPSRWTADQGRTFLDIDPRLLAVARSIAARATARLSDLAPVDDGPCGCSGTSERLELVPTLRTSRVIVGGKAETDDTGKDDTCSADGGELQGCNPCPPGETQPKTVRSTVTAGASTATEAARLASEAAEHGGLVPDAASLLARVAIPPPVGASRGEQGIAGPGYIADDQQTTAAMVAARHFRVPFIAFRGVSDTSAVGNLWPAEYLVYQALAADNAAVAARLFVGAWRGGAGARRYRQPSTRTTNLTEHP